MNDKPKVIFIPNNYKAGLNVLGFEIKIFTVVQAVALAAIPFIFTYLIIPQFYNLNVYNKYIFGITMFFAAGLGYLGFVGIGGMTLGEFVVNFVNFKKRQRVAYYNPRVKREILSIFAEEEVREELPRDKIIAMYSQYKEKMDAKNRETMAKSIEEINNVEDNVFFEDDFGFVSKPLEYMTQKEYKQYQKQQAKAAKQAKKEQKKAEKLAAKEAKKAAKDQKKKGTV